MINGPPQGILSATLPLQTRLADRDPAELVRSIAALQLLPDNAGATLRLELLAHVAASIEPNTISNDLSTSKLEELCNEGPIEHTLHHEDPFTNLFTQGVNVPGAEAISFPGIVEQSAYLHTRFLEALRILDANHLSSDRVHEELEVLLAACQFGNRVALRAGLERSQPPQEPHPRGDVRVPPENKLEHLKNAASIPKDRWARVANILGLPPDALDRITLPLGDVDLINYQLSAGELNTRPIVDTDEAYCAAIPSMLLPAARHAILLSLLDDGHHEAFAQAFATSVWGDLQRAMARFNFTQLALDVPDSDAAPTPYREGIFQIDFDKAFYVLLITDSLADYDPKTPFGLTPTEGIPAFVETRVEQAADAWQAHNGPNGNLSFLIVHQGVGRTFVSGFNPPDHPALDTGLLLSAAALDMLSLLEVGNQLFLWKLAKAVDRLQETTRVNHTDFMDVIALYRDRDKSFYVADEAKPDSLHIPAGTKRSVVDELWGRHNPHWAPSWDRSHSQRVANRYDKREIPIYFPIEGPQHHAPHLVEGLPRFVWILAARPTDIEETSVLRGLADAISYWVWQATPYLAPLEGWSTFPHPTLNIEVDIEDPESWYNPEDEELETSAPTINLDHDERTLHVSFTTGLRQQLERPDNQGERTILKHLLPALQSLITDKPPTWSEDDIQAIIDDIAPLGLKKKILLLDAHHSPALRSGDLPPWRPVQGADKERLLDELGTYLLDLGYEEGPIPEGDRQDALNAVVEWLYERLEDRCARLDPEGLLEFVLAHHDALTHARAEHELLLPTRRACFGETPEMLEAIKKEHLDFTNAAVATRFLVEYLAAQPPAGEEPISLATYDNLIALCSLIADLGFESDYLHFDILDHDLHVLPSGRIGRPEPPTEEAIHAFGNLYVPYEVQRQADRFPDHWRDPDEAGEKPEFIKAFDQAAEEEFGLSITDQLVLLVEAVNLAEDHDKEPATLPKKILIDRIGEATGLRRDEVEQGLELLSLKSRNDFLTPPDPFDQRDVYPWLFNRELSFIRRPFIQQETNGEVAVVWGKRHTWVSLQNLQALCSTGRLPCASEKLQKLIGEMNHRRGKEYNAYIGETIEKGTSLKVHVNWDAQGLMAEDGDPLGDIDVLVPDRNKATLYATECKRLALARTPQELDREMGTLFGTRTPSHQDDGSAATVDKHLRRTTWMKKHLDEIVDMLGLDPNVSWTVEPVLLLDKPMLSPFLAESPIPVLVEDQLRSNPLDALQESAHEG